MALDVRYFDRIEKVVRDLRRNSEDTAATLFARLGAHTHSYIPNSLLDAKGDLIVATANDTAARLPIGSDNQILVADSAQSTGVKWTSTVVGDAAWQTFTFANSWTDNTFARYRMMPDGTVMFRGIITKATNPTNGQTVITGLPVAYRPSQRANFLCPCSSRAYNGAQKLEIQTNGTVLIWDMAAASGDVCLDPIRYSVL